MNLTNLITILTFPEDTKDSNTQEKLILAAGQIERFKKKNEVDLAAQKPLTC